jgi:hypothetical protein
MTDWSESTPRAAAIAERMFPAHALPLDTLAGAHEAGAGALPAGRVEPVVHIFADRVREWCASWADADAARREGRR